MKRTLPITVALATCLGASSLFGQAPQQPPQPQPPGTPPQAEPGRPPVPPSPPLDRRAWRKDDESRDRERPNRKDRERREVPMKPQPFLGVVTSPVPPPVGAQLNLPKGFGLLVENVLPDSPAKAAGLQEYDILKLLNDQQLIEPGQLAALIHAAGKDAEVTLTIIRKGQEQKLTVKIEERNLPVHQPFGVEVEKRIREFGGAVREHAREIEEEAREQHRRAKRTYEELRERMQERRNLDEQGARPSGDMPREPKPGGPQSTFRTESSSSTAEGSKSRVLLKDQDGEVEVTSENGNRVMTAKNHNGDVLFNGPVNTPEQIKAVPEKFREKLERIQIR